MKVLLIILGVLFLIGCIPVGVLFRYHGEVRLSLVIAMFRIGILPKKPPTPKQAKKQAEKKEKKEAQKKEKKKKQQAQSLIAKPPEPPKPKKPLKDTVSQLVPWAKLGAGFVGEFFHRKLCVQRLRIRVALAGGDPAKLAMNSARAWEAVGIALPILERAFRIKERKIAVYPDFREKKTDLEAELMIRLRIGGLVLLAFKYGFKAVKVLITQKKRAKAARKEKALAEAEAKAQEETEPEASKPAAEAQAREAAQSEPIKSETEEKAVS